MRRGTRLAGWVAAAVAAIFPGLGGCGASASGGPERALDEYARAVQQGRVDRAYDLLSDGARRRFSRGAYRRAFAENRAEMAAAARELRQVARQSSAVTIDVPLEGGGLATVVRGQDDEWRIAGGVGGVASLRSPRQTLWALRNSLKARDYGSLLRVLARDVRGALEEEVRRTIEALEDIDRLPIQLDGNRARVTVRPGHSLELVFEDGEWRLKNAD